MKGSDKVVEAAIAQKAADEAAEQERLKCEAEEKAKYEEEKRLPSVQEDAATEAVCAVRGSARGDALPSEVLNAQQHAEKEAEVKAVRGESLGLLQATAIAGITARARLGGGASGRSGSVA
jgi:hypothetical protein